MKFELRPTGDLPEGIRICRANDAAAEFCREEDYPGVTMRLEKWPTCIGETEVAVYRPTGCDEVLPVYYYIHGGGFVTRNLKFLDHYCRLVVQNTGVCVISPEYHLAPENPYPGLFLECWDVINYAKDHSSELKIDPARIAVGGDSAGGNLAASLTVKDVEENTGLFKTQLLYYPGVDRLRERDDSAPGAPSGGVGGQKDFLDQAYLNGYDPKDPYISPFYASDEITRKLPQALMVISQLDSLYPEGEDYAMKLARAGVTVTLRSQLEGTHGTLNRKNWGYEDTLNLTYRYINANLK